MFQEPQWMEKGIDNPLQKLPELLQATMHEFTEYAFNDASLNRILKAAGMNKGSLYHRFYDKLDLYVSLIHVVGLEKMNYLRKHREILPTDGFFDVYRKNILVGLRFAKEHPQYDQLWRNVLGESTQLVACIQKSLGGLLEDGTAEILKESFQAGIFREDIKQETLLIFIATATEGLNRMIKPNMTEDEILSCADDAIRVMKYGVCK